MNKYKISIGCLFMLILFASSVFAFGEIDFDLSYDSSDLSNVRYGDTTSVTGYIINNDNADIRCDWTTSQGGSGSTSSDISPGSTSQFTFSVYANTKGQNSILLSADCRMPGFFDIGRDQRDKNIPFTATYCGDGSINGNEQCDGNSKPSCQSKGYDYGSTLCSNCNLLTTNCFKCQNECSQGNKKCSGNGYIECITDNNGCYKWSTVKSCGSDKACTGGTCISITTDQNCGEIGNSCNTVKKEGAVIRTYCSGDSKAVQVKQVTYEKCINKQCVVQKEEKELSQNCYSPNPYCQDGSCGCSDGYEVCEPFKKCVKKKDVKLNQPCKCDFQCEEGFCDETSSQCVKGLNVKISSSNSALSVGEETTVSLSVANPLNKDVEADITLSLGDGIELVEVLSGDQCSGSQCKLDRATIPAGGKKDVTVRVKANTDTTALMNAFVNYQLGSKKIELKDKTSIKIIECGNGKLEDGETSETCCIDAGCPSDDQFYSFTCNKKTKSCNKSLHSYYLYGGGGALLLIFLIIFGISRAVKHHKSPEREKAKKRKEEEKEAKKQEKEEKKKEKEEVKEEKHEVSGSIAKEIEHLHSLMEKGVLTKREFKNKKKELLKKKA